MRRHWSPQASRAHHVRPQFDETELGEGLECRSRQGRSIRAEARSECRGPHGAIFTQKVQDAHSQRRCHWTNRAGEAHSKRLYIEPDANDVGDALRGRHLADDQVRPATRHQPMDLASHQRRHLGLPAESAMYLITGIRARRK
ncbi:hypothetical protein [Mycolicibacterium gadium]|uniref:Transposase n=1 Tax=Mycolicibacterium gadium TaxID=1794 RepID=A0ABT6H058_MYCGU|nr:hypothetical protein [Mycolicibacterium gadium]MDG5486949.1 hypothetical protein [Mycolicibacterium gadium]